MCTELLTPRTVVASRLWLEYTVMSLCEAFEGYFVQHTLTMGTNNHLRLLDGLQMCPTL